MRPARRIISVILSAAALPLISCAAPSSYMGIDITSSAKDIGLTEEQKAYLRDRRVFMSELESAGCFASGTLIADMVTSAHVTGPAKIRRQEVRPQDTEPQDTKLSKAQLKRCASTARQLAELERYRPAFSIIRDIRSERLSSVARRASNGDKQAQLELGKRFEAGRGVACDKNKARKLYGKAATDSGGTIWVYSPPVGKSAGRVIPVNAGPKQVGLAEAKERLEGLR